MQGNEKIVNKLKLKRSNEKQSNLYALLDIILSLCDQVENLRTNLESSFFY